MAKKAPPRSKTTKKVTRPSKTAKISTVNSTRRVVMIAFVLLFAAVGTYLIVAGHAQSIEERKIAAATATRPDLGIDYTGKEIQTKGPCKGEVITNPDANGKKACAHLDPGPSGQDTRIRDKKMDEYIRALDAYDKAHPALATDAPLEDPSDAIPEVETNDGTSSSANTPADTSTTPGPIGAQNALVAADVGWRNDLAAVTPRDWPCIGTGSDGPRVRVIYAYKAGNTNRISALRDNIGNIMRRTNNVVFNSSGGHRQIRFLTNPNCTLSVPALALTGDINDFDNVKNQVIAAGYHQPQRKFIVEIDGGTGCGLGERQPDDRKVDDNRSNVYNGYSFVWRPCWNYGEPHEFGHMIGGVQDSAPHVSLHGHCTDPHDVMCYDDLTDTNWPISKLVCTSQTKIWRYDCNDNDYFAVNTTNAYLTTHWNAADSIFLAQN